MLYTVLLISRYIIALSCLAGIFCGPVFGQIGLKNPPVFTIETVVSDSTLVTFSQPVLPLRNWSDMNDRYIDLEHPSNSLDPQKYIVPVYISDSPFSLDLRETSNYVPPMVRDELNLIMNRPKDAAFLPILPVAFLAMQLASQYLIVQKKTEITYKDIINSTDALPVLHCLWAQSPQTLTALFHCDSLQKSDTVMGLQQKLDLLIKNKLIRQRVIENAETKYFPAISKKEYDDIRVQGKFGTAIQPGTTGAETGKPQQTF